MPNYIMNFLVRDYGPLVAAGRGMLRLHRRLPCGSSVGALPGSALSS